MYTLWTDPLEGPPPSRQVGGEYHTRREADHAGIALEATHGPCIVRYKGWFVGAVVHLGSSRRKVDVVRESLFGDVG